MKNFKIYSRNDIQKIIFDDDENAVISISTPLDEPDSNYPKINCKNVVFVECDDVSYNTPSIFIIGHQPVENVVKYFSEDDATKILDFVNANIDKDFSIHCDQGISRSPGVAVGLCKIMGIDTKSYYSRYKPNDLIVNTITNVYYENMDRFPMIGKG